MTSPITHEKIIETDLAPESLNDAASMLEQRASMIRHSRYRCDVGDAVIDEGLAATLRAIAARDLYQRLQAEKEGGAPFDLIAYLIAHQTWSAETFGPGRRTAGILAHIEKEIGEVRRAPADLVEWIDIIILAFDGAWRAGHSPEDIAGALQAKQTANMAREWPALGSRGENEPIEHVRPPASATAGTGRATQMARNAVVRLHKLLKLGAPMEVVTGEIRLVEKFYEEALASERQRGLAEGERIGIEKAAKAARDEYELSFESVTPQQLAYRTVRAIRALTGDPQT